MRDVSDNIDGLKRPVEYKFLFAKNFPRDSFPFGFPKITEMSSRKKNLTTLRFPRTLTSYQARIDLDTVVSYSRRAANEK